MNIFKQFIKSIYSPKEVALFRFQGIGKTIGYVFLLMFLSNLLTGIALGIDFTKWVSITGEKIILEVPDFEINKKGLTSNLNSPLIKENQDFTFFFDSTGQLTLDDVSEHSNALGLLQKEIVVISNSDIQKIPYSSFGNISIKKKDLITFINSLDSLLIIILPILFLFMYLFTTSLKFIGISVLALIGTLLIKQVNRYLQYRHLWILSSYAVTIPTIFFAIIKALKIYIHFSFLLYWVTAIIVLYLIIVEIPKANLTNDQQQPIE